MAIINNIVTEIGDVLVIQVDTPILGLVMLNSFVDVTVGTTGIRYFDKKFRYSVDGINFSDWTELTNENIESVIVSPTNTFIIQYHFERSGTDATGDLEFDSVTINGAYEVLATPDLYNRSIFAQFFDFYDINVLRWALNVLEKLYKGIVPKYIERGVNDNITWEDKSFLDFWRSITHYFALFVYYVRLFETVESNDKLLQAYLKSHDLYINDDISNVDAIYLMNYLFDEIRQRGTIQIALEKDNSSDESSSSLLNSSYEKQVDGELLRLIGKTILDEFIFCPLEPEKVGWTLNESSPLYLGINQAFNAIKWYEKSQGVIDISKYPTINSQYFSLVNENDEDSSSTLVDESKIGILKISGVSSGEVSGIGLDGYFEESLVVYYNTEQSQVFTRDDCSVGYAGSDVTYTVLANTYSSFISQLDADQKALTDIADNGQIYANSHGSCTLIPIALLDEDFSNWSAGLPVDWQLPSFVNDGLIVQDGNRLKLTTVGSGINATGIVYNDVFPYDISATYNLQITIKVDEISADQNIQLQFMNSSETSGGTFIPTGTGHPIYSAGTYVFTTTPVPGHYIKFRVLCCIDYPLATAGYCIIDSVKVEEI